MEGSNNVFYIYLKYESNVSEKLFAWLPSCLQVIIGKNTCIINFSKGKNGDLAIGLWYRLY